MATSVVDLGKVVGPPGPQGNPGAAGSPGANGKSAYQQAVESGYTGTEAELSAALNAVPGHIKDTTKHITPEERTAWNDKSPKSHTHVASDITSGTMSVSRGGTGASTLALNSYLVGNGAGTVKTKTPAEVLNDIGAGDAKTVARHEETLTVPKHWWTRTGSYKENREETSSSQAGGAGTFFLYYSKGISFVAGGYAELVAPTQISVTQANVAEMAALLKGKYYKTTSSPASASNKTYFFDSDTVMTYDPINGGSLKVQKVYSVTLEALPGAETRYVQGDTADTYPNGTLGIYTYVYLGMPFSGQKVEVQAERPGERDVKLIGKDSAGNPTIDFPITRIENVEGAEELLSYGGKFKWQYNAATNSLDLVVL